jgi:probable rRNA maturation factor
MRYKINLQVKTAYTRKAGPRVLRAAARAALAHQSAPMPGELTIVVTDAETIRALNRAYARRDHATDVLSFPADEPDPASGRRYFGDVVIAFPQAAAQAKVGGHPLSAELQLLVVHGVLHLLGHDHASPGDKARMWKAQAEILHELRAAIAGP